MVASSPSLVEVVEGCDAVVAEAGGLCVESGFAGDSDNGAAADEEEEGEEEEEDGIGAEVSVIIVEELAMPPVALFRDGAAAERKVGPDPDCARCK